MQNIIKKILLSWLIIYFAVLAPVAFAASAGGWSMSGYDIATGIVSAIKNGTKSTAAVARSPIVGNIAKGIVGGALAAAAVPLAISQITGLALDAVDWVLDPANNAIKYNSGLSGQDKCEAWAKQQALSEPLKSILASGFSLDINYTLAGSCSVGYNGNFVATTNFPYKSDNEYKTIPVSTVAEKIYDNAKTGDSNSVSAVTAAVTEYVNSGAADTALDTTASDNNTTHNCGTGTYWSGSACVADTPNNPDTPPAPNFDPSSIIAAIQSAMTNIANAISNLSSTLSNNINTLKDELTNKITDMQTAINDLKTSTNTNINNQTKVINDGIDKITDKQDDIKGVVVGVGDKVDAVGGKVVGVGDKVDAVGGKVVGVGDKVDTVGDKVVGVGDKVDAVGGKVVGVGDKVDAVGGKVVGVGDKVDAVGDKVTDAVDKVTDAIKERDKDTASTPKPTDVKPFELPSFCSWASVVCDAIDWVKAEPDPQPENKPDIDPSQPTKSANDFDTNYINYGGQCPQSPSTSLNIGGQTINLSLDLTPLCDFVVMVRPAILAMAYLAGLFVVARAVGETQ